jgi:hypothetical protein
MKPGTQECMKAKYRLIIYGEAGCLSNKKENLSFKN